MSLLRTQYNQELTKQHWNHNIHGEYIDPAAQRHLPDEDYLREQQEEFERQQRKDQNVFERVGNIGGQLVKGV